MIQLCFLVEHNLSLLQPVLRSAGHSVFLPFDEEIGLSLSSPDKVIIDKIAEQKKSLGIDRIIITRDVRFINFLGSEPVKLIILSDKTTQYELYSMRLKRLAGLIIIKAKEMMNKTTGQAVEYIDCSQFY